MTIISEQSESIRHAIIEDLNRGVTVYQGRGGRTDASQDILFCVVTRLEVGRVRSIVLEKDAAAFFVVHALANAEGGFVKRPALH